jgi:predicted ATPase
MPPDEHRIGDSRPAIFICHSSKDRETAYAVCAELELANIRCWIAPRDPIAGVPYAQQIFEAIVNALAIVIIVSENSVASAHVLREIELAASEDRPILPLRIGDTKMSGGLAYYLRSLHWITADPRNFASALAELRASLAEMQGDTTSAGPTVVQPVAAFAATNLPASLTRLVGREQALSEAQALQRSSRLLTLVGTAGIGKSRLAGALGRIALEDFAQGVWYVAFREDDASVERAIARELSVIEAGQADVRSALVQRLAHLRMLLVFDSVERVVDPLKRWIRSALIEHDHLHIIVASRQILGISGERTYEVAPLAWPHEPATLRAEEIARYPAVELFLDRARDIDADFQFDDRNAVEIANVCRRLDGLPLPIELVAARLRVLSIGEIALRLDKRFKLLQSPELRFATVLEMCFESLTETEQCVFLRASVFRGSFQLVAAEAVCADEHVEFDEVLDALQGCIAKSVVRSVGLDRSRSFVILETLRAYAIDRFGGTAEYGATVGRHAHWYAEFARASVDKLIAEEDPEVFDRIQADLENLRAAFEAQATRELRLCIARAAAGRGALSEARELLEIAASHDSLAALELGTVASFQGDLDCAEQAYAKALELAREQDDTLAAGRARNGQGNVCYQRGDAAGAEAGYAEARDTARRVGDQVGLAKALNNLGITALLRDARTEAVEFFNEALKIFSSRNDRVRMAWTLANIGVVLTLEGDFARAGEALESSLQLRERTVDRRGVADTLSYLADLRLAEGNVAEAQQAIVRAQVLYCRFGYVRGFIWSEETNAAIAARNGRAEEAVAQLGSTAEWRLQLHIGSPAWSRRRVDALLSELRETLGDGAFERAWETGRAVPLAIAMDRRVNPARE